MVKSRRSASSSGVPKTCEGGVSFLQDYFTRSPAYDRRNPTPARVDLLPSLLHPVDRQIAHHRCRRFEMLRLFRLCFNFRQLAHLQTRGEVSVSLNVYVAPFTY